MAATNLILLVEDLEDDAVLIRKAFQRAFITNPLHVVSSGEEAIAYLSGKGRFSDRNEYPFPSLVLLDLKMPIMDGFEVLQWIRSQPDISGIAVVVLTGSDQIRDVNRAYALGANSFLVKPLEFENHVRLSAIFREYWLQAARLPQLFPPPPVANPNHPPP